MSAPLPPDAPQVDPTEASRMIEGGAFLLDVREDDEWGAGHAPLATHVRLGDVPTQLEAVPTDRTVIAVCRAGGRSQQAATFLREQGIEAMNLAGGMQAWAGAGLAVVTESGQPGTVI